MMRRAIQHLGSQLTRRGFLKTSVRGAGLALFWERFGHKLFAGDNAVGGTDPRAVFSGMGKVVIPVDDDPGWVTFEPGITDFAMNVMVKQVLLAGDELSYQGLLATFVAFNDLPPLLEYSFRPFLEMGEAVQQQYFGDVLAGQFENDGAQDVLFLAAFVGLFSTKAVFFSNYPNHLATPGAEFQVRAPSNVKTGWDIMGFRGPVGPEEERQLREKFSNIEVLPGVDPNNPYF